MDQIKLPISVATPTYNGIRQLMDKDHFILNQEQLQMVCDIVNSLMPKDNGSIMVAICNKCNTPYPFGKHDKHECLEQDILDYKKQQSNARSINDAHENIGK